MTFIAWLLVSPQTAGIKSLFATVIAGWQQLHMAAGTDSSALRC